MRTSLKGWIISSFVNEVNDGKGSRFEFEAIFRVSDSNLDKCKILWLERGATGEIKIRQVRERLEERSGQQVIVTGEGCEVR